MFCPECQKLGLKSKVYIGPSFAIVVHNQPFYDEEGVFHNHDTNTQMSNYSCSNHHVWTIESTKSKCPSCDFGKEDNTIDNKTSFTS